jgi:SAM-dependent methyltransferase
VQRDNIRSLELQEVACPRCNSREAAELVRSPDRLYGIKGEFRAVSCSGCDLWFQNPRPTAATVDLAYPEDYGPYDSKPVAPSNSTAKRILAAINPIRRRYRQASLVPEFVPGGRLIELGCANGAFLQSLRDLGWSQVYGVELSEAAARKGRAAGLDIECAPIETALAAYPDGHFDVVVSSMVLEHLYDPFSVIRLIASKLKPGGQFLFSTIVHDSLDAQIYGRYWAGFDLPRHMVYFSHADLLAALNADYEEAVCIHQLAWADFWRSSSWRRQDGVPSLLDRIVLVIGSSVLGELVSLPIAMLGKTSRVSLRCRRKSA